MTKFFFRSQRVWLFALPLALFSASLLTCSLGNTAHASSIFDDTYQPTKELDVYDHQSSNSAFQCSHTDLTTTWSTYITDESKWQFGKTTIMPTVKSSFLNALDHGRWGVSQYYGGNVNYISVYWTENTSLSLDWFGATAPDTLVRTSGVYQITIACAALYYNDDGQIIKEPAVMNPGTWTTQDYIPISYYSDPYGWKNFFVYSDHLNYPDGYAGKEVLQEYTPLPVRRPDFDYSVADLNVVARDKKQDLPKYTAEAGYYFKGYSVEWFLLKCGEPWDDVTKTCSDTTVENTETLPIGSKYETDAGAYGDYILSAEYVATECYRYPSYPATPDNCYLLSLKTQFPDYDFKPTTVYLKIDGKTFSGSTGNLECDVSGYCEPADDGLGMFHALDDINTFGLSAFLTAPIDFYATLPALATTCSPITVPFIASTYSFELECVKPRYQAWSPTIFSIWQTVLIAGVGWLIAFNIFRTIKNINTPDKDGIEVAKL